MYMHMHLFSKSIILIMFIQNPSKAKMIRKFIVAEGLYMNSGDLVDLPKLVRKLTAPLGKDRKVLATKYG